MSLVRFTDDQLGQIFQLTRPLQPQCRDTFLQLLAAELQGRGEVGDGELHRLMCRIIADHSLFTAPSAFEASRPGRRRSA